MDYLYENLGDERFQEFCASLISKEFPNIQSFPVGQPDGGRDAVVYYMDSIEKGFIVFQVKFVKNANEERDVHKWLTDIIEGEVKKINILIPKGAVQYYLITNVRGTAHLDVGSKDKVNKILEDNIKIPSVCWWRDDLNTLFKKDPLFMWSFPEIINGQDVLNSVLFNNLNENKEKRETVVKAYLVDQYESDNEVKFKQIDLKNKLLDLFTDVPIKIKKFNVKNKLLKKTFFILENSDQNILFSDYLIHSDDKQVIGAAEFLLHPKVQKNIERILLEGGPGQGKSTISQYVSQVHRVRLLNKSNELNSLPDNIRHTPVRLPFKIDLRHVASWVENKNPYQETLNEDYFKNNWSKNLESFLVGHIFSHSKLEDFTTSDLISIFKLSPILLVFDGFDEIATVQMRAEVIDFINKGVTRISSHAKSIQIIVTSRPAAFLDSVGFSVENYPHFELTNITPTIITEYLEKWIKASDLSQSDAKDLRKLVKEKLEMPHLKDLAKSPMQLAILISLLRTKGKSLPNKRTSLYDNYIDLFFDRESEKSTLILEKRELIINIHQYLAWILHSEAELYKNSGILHIDDLKVKVKDYLSHEGHDTSIADILFDVMKERVCALVSRVQGTFEFEVQPLREYFCAKHLYKTAPHSDAGSVKSGTKPERLHAILRNFYWQNVVRFFAGCADRGELDMIIQELKDLQNDTLLKYTDYPRIITSQILSDYVFTQAPLKLKDVVALLVTGINIGNIINQKETSSANEPILLPIECGRNEIIEESFNQLKKFPSKDYAAELIGIINNNPNETLEKWQENLNKIDGVAQTKWLEYGYNLQLIHKVDEIVLVSLVSSSFTDDNLRRLQLIINGNRFEIIENRSDLKELAFKAILNGDLKIFNKKNSNFSLRYLTVVLHPLIFSYIFNSDYNKNLSLLNHLGRFAEEYSGRSPSTTINKFIVNDEIDKKVKDFETLTVDVFELETSKFYSSIEPWDKIVETGRRIFGENFSLLCFAIIGAGIKSKSETFDEFQDLHNVKISLCKRVRCARMKSGNTGYWDNLLNNKDEVIFTLAVFLNWATPKTFIQLLKKTNSIINLLSDEDFATLNKFINNTLFTNYYNKTQQNDIERQISLIDNNERLIYLISLRLSQNYGERFFYENFGRTSKSKDLNALKFNQLISDFKSNPNDKILKQIKDMYPQIDGYDGSFVRNRHDDSSIEIPYDLAKFIMDDCKHYPRIISAMAEKACRIYANNKLIPIGKIAVEENWFE
jgi:hypothetical protein